MCIIVKEPDTYYYNKLVRVMKYIQHTILLTLILSIDKSDNINWYVDSAFAVHKYIRIHSVGLITIVTGGAYFQYRKQKFNTKSSA